MQNLINFIDQASGIQPSSADSQNPLTGDPGGSVNTANSSIQFASNIGDPNAVSIGLSALQVVTPTGTQAVNLNFNTTQASVGTGATTSVVVYDSLGDPLTVTINAVLQSTSASGTVYRWTADSSDNQPASGNSIAVGTGEVEFDSQGNLTNVTNDQISIAARHHRRAAAAIQPQLFFRFRPIGQQQQPGRQPSGRLGHGHAQQLHDRWQRPDHRSIFQRRDA